MSIAESLEGFILTGSKTKSQWRVDKRLRVPEDRSQPNFSVGYKVVGHDGRQAFMKATDASLLTEDNGTLLTRMHAAIQGHSFERSILDHCRGNNMDKIVISIDYGDALLEYDGIREPVFFLIFELAEGDMRANVITTEKFAVSSWLGILQDVSTAVQQLHVGQVSHNDIKPANILMFSNSIQKLGDLGRATSPLFSALHNDEYNAGDMKYAAPEILYAVTKQDRAEICSFDGRRAADLYNLGSMIYFSATGAMLTPQIIAAMSQAHCPAIQEGGWSGDYASVIPYWREAFSRTLVNFKEAVSETLGSIDRNITQELMASIRQLCEPDVKLRGHPVNQVAHQNKYSLQQYISMFDRMRHQVRVLGRA